MEYYATAFKTIEYPEDVQVLKDAGCDELQEYYFARPMPAEKFSDWLAGHGVAVV